MKQNKVLKEVNKIESKDVKPKELIKISSKYQKSKISRKLVKKKWPTLAQQAKLKYGENKTQIKKGNQMQKK